MRPTWSILLLALLASAPAFAQPSGTHDPATHGKPGAGQTSGYSGMELRDVKALSGGEIADLEAGRGMGLALAAELNGYPGPVHVLELAEQLALTPSQRLRTKDLLETTKAKTISLGRGIIALERRLDGLFAEKRITADALAETTARIAAEQGKLRAAHLRSHLEMAKELTLWQVTRYATLRGYAAAAR